MHSKTADGAVAPTRLTYRGQERREQILKVAKAMFLEKGFAGVSVDEILKTVGGSKTNLYKQFGSKENLFLVVVETLCADFIRDFKQIDVAGMPPAEGLKTLARQLLNILLQERHVAFQRLIIAESGRFPMLGKVWLESGPEQSRRTIARFIEIKQGEGQMRSADPLLAATLFHDMVTFNPIHLAMLGTRPRKKTIEQFIDEAVAVFLQGYYVPGKAGPQDGRVSKSARSRFQD